METISWEDRDGTRWIALEGELDHDGCRVVRDRFERAVREGSGDIVVAMGGVTFLASMGVAMLLRARAALAAQGRTLRLSGVSPAARTALELMNLTDVFETP